MNLENKTYAIVCDRHKARSPEYRRIPSWDYHPWKRARPCKVSPRADRSRRRNKGRTAPGRERNLWAPDTGTAPSSRSSGSETAEEGEKSRAFPSLISWRESRRKSPKIFQTAASKFWSWKDSFFSFSSLFLLSSSSTMSTAARRDVDKTWLRGPKRVLFRSLVVSPPLWRVLVAAHFPILPSPNFAPLFAESSLSLFLIRPRVWPSFLPMQMHSNGCTGTSFIALHYYRCKIDICRFQVHFRVLRQLVAAATTVSRFTVPT